MSKVASPIQTTGIILFYEGKVLLVRHLEGASHVTGAYGLPAGKIEDGESETYAAKRELEEETGLITSEADLVKLPKVYEATIQLKSVERTFIWHVFLCKKWTGKLKSSEETNPEWVPIENIKKYPLLPNVESAVKEGLQMNT